MAIRKSPTLPPSVASIQHGVPITHSPRPTKPYSAKAPPMTTPAIVIMVEMNGSCSTGEAALVPLEEEVEVEDEDEDEELDLVTEA